MSIFASRTRRVVEIPFDAPHTVTIQKLAGRQVEKAREANQFASADRLKGMGGVAFQRELGQLGDPAATAALVAKAQADPLNTYDRATVLQKGIVAWTYEEPVGTPLLVTPEAIDDLSEEAADFLARAILELTLPARDEVSKKKD
jgi:hypothetical protein